MLLSGKASSNPPARRAEVGAVDVPIVLEYLKSCLAFVA